MTDLLFETPWWFPTALVALGAVLFFAGNNRIKTGLRNAGLGAALLGVLVACVSYFVDTAKEKVTQRTYAMVDVAGKQKWDEVQNYLSPGVQFNYQGRLLYDGREMMINSARSTASRIGLTSAIVTGLTREQTGPAIHVTMRVFSEQSQAPRIPSDWRLTWREEAGHWVVTDMTLDGVADLNAGQIQNQLR